MQKVDALIDLRMDDPAIDRDAKILESIKDTARHILLYPKTRRPGVTPSSLYCRYRGKGFPLQNRKGLRIPAWRNLTPWMKVQLASLSLAERGYMPFKLHIHDDLLAELEANGRDKKDYLRDAIARHLKRRLGWVPWFFFVIEDQTKDGQLTRPHAHGSIEMVRVPLPSLGPGSRKLRKIERLEGIEKAQIAAGRSVVSQALKAAGDAGHPRIARATGVDQSRNLWRGRPYHPFFNTGWVDYAFKNSTAVSSTLSDNRLALPYNLRGEARRLWRLLTAGESAMAQWGT